VWLQLLKLLLLVRHGQVLGWGCWHQQQDHQHHQAGWQQLHPAGFLLLLLVLVMQLPPHARSQRPASKHVHSSYGQVHDKTTWTCGV